MEETYVDVIIDIAHEKVDRPFQYRIPPSLLGKLELGSCVEVPFGRGDSLRKGYVVGFSTTPFFEPEKIKPVRGKVTGGVAVEERMIRLAAWMKEQYGGTMIQALKTVIPAKQKVKTLEKKTLLLSMQEEEAREYYSQCVRKHKTAQARLLEALLELKEMPYELATGKLQISAATIRSLTEQRVIREESESYYRDPVHMEQQESKELVLSQEQQQVVSKITQDFSQGKTGSYLLYGITGSGKTQVYIALIQEMIRQGKQAIVLIPEIALTYQTLSRFYKQFRGRVSVINSSLSPGEKYDQCMRAKEGLIDVVIGPRSALFTPFPNLGLIVMDEEQESSYKSESAPKYHAREVAAELARQAGASVLYGSATPSLETYYQVKKGNTEVFHLTKRLTGGLLPQVYVADLREELKQGNRSIFSRKLQELIAERLERKEQMMLFLNRRGYAGFISCRACGLVIKCPHCDVSLSQHKNGRMVCHYCGYTEGEVKKCPSCGSPYVSGFRAGTQQIEEKLKEMFPQARVLRMDGDTTKKKESYQEILSAFSGGEADVLIGTQMIVKGHDFPNVTLVGILAADMSLSANDYRAGERTFQLLTQAAGRAGRGEKPGEVVIQTYQPEHYSIVHAANQDYQGFYQEEILYREMLGYPPVSHMMGVQVFAPEERAGQELSLYLKEKVPKEVGIQVIGPAPASIGKIHDIFRFAFYIKCGNYDKLVKVKNQLEEEIQNLQLKRESIQFDFDPVNVF